MIVRVVLTSFIFYSTFAINEILRLYVVASFLCIFVTLRKRAFKKYSTFIFCLLIFFAYLVIVSLVEFNQKSLNYTAAHFYVFVFTPLACVALAEGLETKKITDFLSTLLIVLCLTGLGFWLSLDFFGVDLEAIIPGAIKRSNRLFAGDRISIFFGEPTYLGMYMCSLGLLPFLDLSSKSPSVVLKLISFVFVLFISKSAAFFGACFFSILITANLVFIQSLLKFRLHIGMVRLGAILLVLISAAAFTVGPSLYLKVMLLDANSGNGRVEMWLLALAAIQNEGWFGNGLGAMALNYGSFLSYILQLIYDGGVVALLLFLIVFGSVYFRVIFSPLDIKSKIILGTSIMAPMIFLATNATFYYPVYVFTSVFALKILSEAREVRRESLFSQR